MKEKDYRKKKKGKIIITGVETLNASSARGGQVYK